MKLAVENYFPQSVKNNQFFFVVWGITSAIVCFWLGLSVVAPILRANNYTEPANWIYTFFSFLCHQLSARSFHYHGESFAVCARCFGVYFGLACGVLIYPLFRSLNNLEPVPRIWLLLAPVPTTIDYLLGVLGVWENTLFSRFSTALLLGLGCAFFLMPGVIEISRYIRLTSADKQ